MNYYFTGILILAMVILALFVEPAYPRNEYLNEYGVRCGEENGIETPFNLAVSSIIKAYEEEYK